MSTNSPPPRVLAQRNRKKRALHTRGRVKIKNAPPRVYNKFPFSKTDVGLRTHFLRGQCSLWSAPTHVALQNKNVHKPSSQSCFYLLFFMYHVFLFVIHYFPFISLLVVIVIYLFIMCLLLCFHVLFIYHVFIIYLFIYHVFHLLVIIVSMCYSFIMCLLLVIIVIYLFIRWKHNYSLSSLS